MVEKEEKEELGQDEVYDLVTSREVSWKSILYDLVNSEQLDPWNVDITLLTNKYLEKIRELEEADFVISSKVLYAASLLLKMKSDKLLNTYLKGIDETLFGKKEEEKTKEKIEIDESELPELMPKTPLPRKKKVSMDELVSSLNRAMDTEKRRIKKKVKDKQAERQTEMVVPEEKPSIKERIKNVYSRILNKFKEKERKISYSELTGNKKEEKLACFLPCLHLHNQQRLTLEQQRPFAEVWIWLYSQYKKEISKDIEDIEIEEEIEKATGFENPVGNI